MADRQFNFARGSDGVYRLNDDGSVGGRVTDPAEIGNQPILEGPEVKDAVDAQVPKNNGGGQTTPPPGGNGGGGATGGGGGNTGGGGDNADSGWNAPPPGAQNPNDYLPFEQWVNTQPAANRAYLLSQGPEFARQFGYKGSVAPGGGGTGGGAPPPQNFDGSGAGTKLPDGTTVQDGERIVHDGNQIRVYRGSSTTPVRVIQVGGGNGGGGGSGGDGGGNGGGGGDGKVDPNATALKPGDQTPFGPIIGGLPGGLGGQWWATLIDQLKNMTDASGKLVTWDPVTGTYKYGDATPDALYKAAQTVYQYALSAATTAATTGYNADGTPTMAMQKQLDDQLQARYAREANPARAYENELARGYAGQNGTLPASRATGLMGATATATASPVADQGFNLGTWEPMSGVGSGGGQKTMPTGTGTGNGAATDIFTGQNESGVPVRTPAVVNAFRMGTSVPTAGNFGQSTVNSSATAPLSTQDFQQANLKTTNNLSPVQRTIIQSFGNAGGVSNDDQNWLQNRGRPKYGSVQAGYALK